jgi:monoamine oxidase
MARTPLAGRFQTLFAELEPPVEEVAAGHTRREALKRAGLLTGGLTAAGALNWLPPANAATAPRIAVVGGGLAGLTCAYRLKQAGQIAQLYEASDRIGGRCWTIRGSFADGQIAEHGGELIDQGHTAIRQLSQELGLNLVNLLSAEQNGTEPFYRFDGSPYPLKQATTDLKAIWQKVHSDVSAASYPTQWDLNTPRGVELDNMSIIDWINESVPGGISSPLGQLLDVAYNIEYGGESSVQSSLNLLYLLGYSGQGNLRIFGPSNEKYHVVGGNDQITDRLAAQLSGQLNRGRELTALRKRSDGSYTLTFGNGSTATADVVVLALPFSLLREVDISGAGFEARKLRAIDQLGMGTNSKLQVGFTRRHWRTLGCNGDTFADTGYQNTWEVSRGQAGASGILVDYTGGDIGASFGRGTPDQRARQFLGQLEPVLPGITGAYDGRATLDYWTGYRWTKGSYSYWKVGQYTDFGGIEGTRQANCHFAGEHTSVDFQGYLNGGVETGARAAADILADLKR